MPRRAHARTPRLVILLAASLAGCTIAREPEADVSATNDSGAADGGQATAAGEWRPLFDGRTMAGWRPYRGTGTPSGWQVVDGAMTRVGDATDIVTVDQFGDFELELEWKVAEGGNSGIMFRVSEEAANSYETGPEVQILDDARHADGRSPLTSAGAAYGLYPAREGLVKPAGEWNAVRLVVNGAHVEQWLNGQKAVEYELWSPEWEAKVRASKFVEWPGFGRARRGHIALQDHGDTVAFRNVRIREIRN